MLWRQFYIILLVLLNAECEKNEIANLVNGNDDFEIITTIDLPDVVEETSGLQLLDSFMLTFNDSGNDPIIYGVSPTSGELLRKWIVKNADNRDWEDITADEQFIYIGDFGNNIGSRRDLTIYKIPHTKLSSSDSLHADKIEFSFEDQTSFIPTIYNHSFDCEAIIALDDSLVIFSKDWKNKITTAYTLPKTTGSYVAELKFQFPADGLITGADYLADENLLVLCGYKNFNPFIWRIYDIDFSKGLFSDAKRYDLTDYSGIQNEGIAFLSADSIYMSTEAKYIKQRMYLIHLHN
jgi:hypothetical protein